MSNPRTSHTARPGGANSCPMWLDTAWPREQSCEKRQISCRFGLFGSLGDRRPAGRRGVLDLDLGLTGGANQTIRPISAPRDASQQVIGPPVHPRGCFEVPSSLCTSADRAGPTTPRRRAEPAARPRPGRLGPRAAQRTIRGGSRGDRHERPARGGWAMAIRQRLRIAAGPRM